MVYDGVIYEYELTESGLGDLLNSKKIFNGTEYQTNVGENLFVYKVGDSYEVDFSYGKAYRELANGDLNLNDYVIRRSYYNPSSDAYLYRTMDGSGNVIEEMNEDEYLDAVDAVKKEYNGITYVFVNGPGLIDNTYYTEESGKTGQVYGYGSKDHNYCYDEEGKLIPSSYYYYDNGKL